MVATTQNFYKKCGCRVVWIELWHCHLANHTYVASHGNFQLFTKYYCIHQRLLVQYLGEPVSGFPTPPLRGPPARGLFGLSLRPSPGCEEWIDHSCLLPSKQALPPHNSSVLLLTLYRYNLKKLHIKSVFKC